MPHEIVESSTNAVAEVRRVFGPTKPKSPPSKHSSNNKSWSRRNASTPLATKASTVPSAFTVSHVRTCPKQVPLCEKLSSRTDIDMTEQHQSLTALKAREFHQAWRAEWNKTKACRFHHAIMLSLLVSEAARYQRKLEAEQGIKFQPRARLDPMTYYEMQRRIDFEMSGETDRYVDIVHAISNQALFSAAGASGKAVVCRD